MLAGFAGAALDVRLGGGIEGGQPGLQSPGIGGRNRKGTAAAFVATRVAGKPITCPSARLGKGGIDGREHPNFRTLRFWRDHLSSVLEIFSIFSIFALFYGVAVFGWMREGLRVRRRAEILDRVLPALLGQDVHRARALLGEPSKIEFGMSGRRLYIWRPPTALALPETPELTVVTLTVEANDIVSRTSWKTD